MWQVQINSLKQVKADLESFSRVDPPLYINSNSVDGKRVTELKEKDVNASVLALHRAASMHPTLRDPAKWMDAFDAYISLREDDFDSSVVLKRQKSSLARLEKDWDEKFIKLEADVNIDRVSERDIALKLKSMAVRQIRKHKRLRISHDKAMGKMRQEFSTEMKLKASEKFWSRKRKLNRLRSKAAFKKLCWVGAIGGLLIFTLFAVLYLKTDLSEKFSVGQTLMFAIPTLAYVWLLRIFANEYKLNQKMADDAEEREAMIFTFKALEHEERVGAEERLIILNSLFRPHDSAAEESIPLPAWEALVGKIQGK